MIPGFEKTVKITLDQDFVCFCAMKTNGSSNNLVAVSNLNDNAYSTLHAGKAALTSPASSMPHAPPPTMTTAAAAASAAREAESSARYSLVDAGALFVKGQQKWEEMLRENVRKTHKFQMLLTEKIFGLNNGA